MISDLTAHSPLGKSDHACLFFKFNCGLEKIHKKRKIFFYNKGNYNEMRQVLRNQDWSDIDNPNIDEAYNNFTLILQDKQNEHIPSKKRPKYLRGLKKHKQDIFIVIRMQIFAQKFDLDKYYVDWTWTDYRNYQPTKNKAHL